MQSTFYVALLKRIELLETNLLPPVPATQINLSQRDIDLTSSFLLLVVAELENFVEEHCNAVADRAENKWLIDSRITPVARALVLAKHVRHDEFKANKSSIFGGAFEVKLNSKSKSKLQVELDCSVKASLISYRQKIKDNHGTHGLRKLLYPLGIYENRLDATLLTNLASIADKRGLAAHTSVAKSANVIPHPSAVKQDVQNILASLKSFDAQIQKLS